MKLRGSSPANFMGTLYLIPTALSVENDLATIPRYVADTVKPLRLFIVEEQKSAQKFLKKLLPAFPLEECRFFSLNEHSTPAEIKAVFQEISGKDAGVLSEAGCPCVADPGADIVLLAHQNNINVVPLVGPSSIILALMASGLNGQKFAFHGYLPREQEKRGPKIKELEKRSAQEGETQIFMEAPYRNESLFKDIIAHGDPRTLLSVACGLASPAQSIKTRPLSQWKKEGASFHKQPAIFLIFRQRN